MLDDRAVPPGGSLFGVGGPAHHPDDEVERLRGRVVDGVGPVVIQPGAQRGVQRAMQRLVMGWQHAIFAMVPAELGKKSHRLLRALGDQLAVHPVQCVGESGSLALHFRREQVADRDVEVKPVGVEPVDELVAQAGTLRREGVAQHLQRVPVV
jgi:hypothetical protein